MLSRVASSPTRSAISRRSSSSLLTGVNRTAVRAHALSASSAITYAQVAAGLSAATASTVEFVDVPGDAARQAMIGDGMPGFVADQIVRMFGMLRQGVAGQVSPDVETLTGSVPRDFASFARDHARLFAPTPATARR